MKINYSYAEYKDFPEATDISESRARNGTLLTMLCFCGLLLSLIFLVLCETVSDWVSGILLVLLFAALTAYMIIIYPRVTEKKIQKAIERKIRRKEEIAATRFKCQYINVLDENETGMCYICYEKNRPLTLCNIKKDKETLSIYICDCCIRKFKANL